MCFTGPQSLFFSLCTFAMAAIVYHQHKSLYLSGSLFYFGTMEFLQWVQYFVIAVPEDGYKQCANPVNQWLTVAGFAHTCFQPIFINAAYRWLHGRYSMQYRHQFGLVMKMCVVAGIWCMTRYWQAVYGSSEHSVVKPNEACPNYEWMREGYDPAIDFTTPNLPGHSCTYQSPTPTGHLAWAVPLVEASYLSPSVSIHSFLFFAPALVMFPHYTHCAIATALTGPILTSYLTLAVNEQAAVWCFYSVAQVAIIFVESMWITPTSFGVPEEKVSHAGGWGEVAMEYQLLVDQTTKTANGTNGHSNGKKHL